jgi:AraC family transcriptional regulator
MVEARAPFADPSGQETFARDAEMEFLEMWQARSVHDYVALNLRANIRASDLAKVAQLSCSHFNAAFRASFGYTSDQFVIRMRIARAQRLMTRSGNSLRKIAVECGFSDLLDFKTRFHTIVGDSPANWRRQAVIPRLSPANPR